jgi:hypothetical protein
METERITIAQAWHANFSPRAICAEKKNPPSAYFARRNRAGALRGYSIST